MKLTKQFVYGWICGVLLLTTTFIVCVNAQEEWNNECENIGIISTILDIDPLRFNIINQTVVCNNGTKSKDWSSKSIDTS